MSLCMESTDAEDFEQYWEQTVAELKTLYPESEFVYQDASDEEGATVGDTEKLVYTECTVSGARAERIDYILVTEQARYSCVKVATVHDYHLYVLTFMFPEASASIADSVCDAVLDSLVIG